MAASPPRRKSLSHWIDSLGTMGSLLCAIHCALLPFALALLPVLGSGLLASSSFELGFVVFATTLAVASIWHGVRVHRAYHAVAFLAPGLVLLWAAVLVPAVHENVLAHAIAMSIGGILVAVAHLVNIKLSQGHVHGEACTNPA